MFRRIPTLVMFLLLIGLLPVAVSAQGGGNRAALVVRGRRLCADQMRQLR